MIHPNNWSMTTISDSSIIIPLTGKKLAQRDYLSSGNIPVIDQGQDFIGGYINDESLLVNCELPVIIFGDHTKALKFINFPFVAGADGIKVLKPKNFFNPRLFFYFLQAIDLPNKGYARHFQYLERATIPLPPLDEQERIVERIESLFGQLDAGVAALKRAQANLKRYKAAVLKAACEGRLVPQDPTDEPAEEMLKRIHPGWSAPSVPADLPELPQGWIRTFVSDIAEVRLGRQRSPSRAFGPNMRHYLRAANVTWDGIDISDVKQMDFNPREQEVYRLKSGDILLSEASGSISEVGKPGLWKDQLNECYIQNTLIRVRTIAPLPEYLCLHFYHDALSKRFRGIAKGVGIHHLGAENFGKWIINLPPIEEQIRIVQEVERSLSLIQGLERTLDNAFSRAARLRQSILKLAFEGRLVEQAGEVDAQVAQISSAAGWEQENLEIE